MVHALGLLRDYLLVLMIWLLVGIKRLRIRARLRLLCLRIRRLLRLLLR